MGNHSGGGTVAGVLGLAISAVALSAVLLSTAVQATPLLVINNQNQLGSFDSADPSSATYRNISGLALGENLLAIDLRPSNNQLYAISSSNRLFTINAATGNASLVADLSSPVYSTASPSAIEIDFNPVADRTAGASLRVVTASGGNFAVNANTGAVTVATSIISGNSGVAYSNSDPSAPLVAPASTQLYYFNSQNDRLLVANTGFNNPVINSVGDFGIDALTPSALEILSSGAAFAVATLSGASLRSALLSVNLGSGALSTVGFFSGASITGLTSAPVPAPATLSLLLGALGLFGLRRFISIKR